MPPPTPATRFFDAFEIDIINALTDQLTAALDALTPAALNEENITKVERRKGVYTLWHDGGLVYVGKADYLSSRLKDHLIKISGRQGISLDQMTFSALWVHPNWTALAPESALIKHYKRTGSGVCEWNGNGFGPHDPGRDRETTNKRPDGFDRRFPIKDEWPCPWFTSQPTWPCLQLLVRLKKFLPYLLRYQTDHIGPKPNDFAHYTTGHADQRDATITVPADDPPTTARGILALIAASMPGWQATVFPSHMILYKENRTYIHGKPA